MTDLEALFLILVIVYATQCISWVAPRAVAFSRSYRGTWRLKTPEIELSAWQIKAVFANLLPFFSGIIVAPSEPLPMFPGGIFPSVFKDSSPGDSDSESTSFLAFDKFQKVEAKGERVLVNGTVIHRAVCPAEARRCASFLSAMAKLSENQRAAVIEKDLKKQFDAKEIGKRLEKFDSATRWTGSFANMLFLLLFVVVPSYIFVGVLTIAWIALIVTTLVVIAVISRSFRRAHRALYPEDGEARWSETLTVTLSPFAAIRARDTLTRNLLAEFDPLSIASVILPANDFQQLAAGTFRNSRYLPKGQWEALGRWEKERLWFEQARNRILDDFLKKKVDDVETFLEPPQANSAESRTFCPRCHTQFRVESGECNDCPGIALLPFPVKDGNASG